MQSIRIAAFIFLFNLGSYAHAATIQSLVANNEGWALPDLAVSQGNLYYSVDDSSQGARHGYLKRTPLTGGDSEILLDMPNAFISYIQVDEGAIYFSCRTFPDLNFAIYSTPITGGAATRLGSLTAAQISAIAVDRTDIYWTEFVEEDEQIQRTVSVKRVARVGGTTEELWTQTDRLTDLDNQMFWGDDIAVDGDSVYWTFGKSGSGRLMKGSKAGGAPASLQADLAGANRIALHGDHVYWTDAEDFSISRVVKTGAAPAEAILDQAHGDMFQVTQVVATDDFVYFGGYAPDGQGMLGRVPVGGGAPAPVTAGNGIPWYCVRKIVDAGDRLVWSNGCNNPQVWSVAK